MTEMALDKINKTIVAMVANRNSSFVISSPSISKTRRFVLRLVARRRILNGTVSIERMIQMKCGSVCDFEKYFDEQKVSSACSFSCPLPAI